jgi:hypothetical protein
VPQEAGGGGNRGEAIQALGSTAMMALSNVADTVGSAVATAGQKIGLW